MSRFGNLEFDNEFDGRLDHESGLPGEAHFLADAQHAFEEGRFEYALRAFGRVMEFNPRNIAAWAGQIRMLIELEEFQEANVWADKALEQFPSEPELLAAKAVALARNGDVNAALTFSDAAIEERGDTPYLWLARGDVLMARNEKRAEYCFEKAHMLAPQDWIVHWLGSRIRFYYGKFAAALKLAQEALALDASQAVVWLQLGQCQEALGLITLAHGSYQQALQVNPQCRDADRALMSLKPAGFFGSIRSYWKRLFLQ